MQRKVQVVRAMHERVAIVGDVQTEHVLERECLGIGRVNHILRAHGDQLMRSGSSPEAFDATVRQEIECFREYLRKGTSKQLSQHGTEVWPGEGLPTQHGPQT